eukprot:TRINITY_DN1735_c0_g3_i1.p1 TRINITY_DN1735_c0_g3~~TRINITY_DN1735_c0_g3_i1.p1  ORF type:complete len:789 (+),score=183.86 TRINITY_DN1735_c0_g3_i1:110-2476(+)
MNREFAQNILDTSDEPAFDFAFFPTATQLYFWKEVCEEDTEEAYNQRSFLQELIREVITAYLGDQSHGPFVTEAEAGDGPVVIIDTSKRSKKKNANGQTVFERLFFVFASNEFPERQPFFCKYVNTSSLLRHHYPDISLPRPAIQPRIILLPSVTKKISREPRSFERLSFFKNDAELQSCLLSLCKTIGREESEIPDIRKRLDRVVSALFRRYDVSRSESETIFFTPRKDILVFDTTFSVSEDSHVYGVFQCNANPILQPCRWKHWWTNAQVKENLYLNDSEIPWEVTLPDTITIHFDKVENAEKGEDTFADAEEKQEKEEEYPVCGDDLDEGSQHPPPKKSVDPNRISMSSALMEVISTSPFPLTKFSHLLPNPIKVIYRLEMKCGANRRLKFTQGVHELFSKVFCDYLDGKPVIKFSPNGALVVIDTLLHNPEGDRIFGVFKKNPNPENQPCSWVSWSTPDEVQSIETLEKIELPAPCNFDWDKRHPPLPPFTLTSEIAKTWSETPNPMYSMAHCPMEMFDSLVQICEKEHWGDPANHFPLLQSYLRELFRRIFHLFAIGKTSVIYMNPNGSEIRVNTNLLTSYPFQRIYGIFERQEGEEIPFRFVRWVSERSYFALYRPTEVDFCDEKRDLFFDAELDIVANIDHILQDDENHGRVQEVVPHAEHHALVLGAIEISKLLARSNYRTAIPQYYPPTQSIQILLPLYLGNREEKNTPDLALVLEKRLREHAPEKSENPKHWYYYAQTVLKMDMAYQNARLITTVDSGWLQAPELKKTFDNEDFYLYD